MNTCHEITIFNHHPRAIYAYLHAVEPARTEQGDVTVATSKADQPPAPFQWQRRVGSESRPDLETLCKNGYTLDKVFKKIMDQPGHHSTFKVEAGLIYY